MSQQTEQRRYQVWCVINPPNPGFRINVDSPEAGAKLIEKMANEQLKEDWIFANAFGLEVLVNGEWEEWNDEQGRDVDEAFREVCGS